MTRRRPAALAALAALLLPLALQVPLAMTGPAHAQEPPPGCARASEEAPVLVDVRTLAPRAPLTGEQPFQVAGLLVNCGREPLRDLEVRLGVGARLDSRSAVGRADDEPVVGSRRLVEPPAQTDLPPGGSTPFDLRLPVADLRLGSTNGVFPLTVQARAKVGDERARLQVGLAHTFLPWFPDGAVAPTRLAWLLPLVDEPRTAPGGVLLDDALDGLLEDDPARPGRLHRALQSGVTGGAAACDPPAQPSADAAADRAAGDSTAGDRASGDGATEDSATGDSAGGDSAGGNSAGGDSAGGNGSTGDSPTGATAAECRRAAVPLTYAVDPDLLATVETMARPHAVLTRGARAARPPSDNARQWLASLRAATAAGSDVLALPYGDPDVVALSRSASPVRDDVEGLRRLGGAVTKDLLGADPLGSIAWVPPGPLGGSVDALAGGQVQTLLLDEGALPEADRFQDRTPNARTTLPTRIADVGALVADQPLSGLLEPDPTAPGWQGARLAGQRWIAEVAALAAERPSTSRTIVVAPRRRADLDPSIVAGAVADTGRLPFLCPVALAAAAAGTERCRPPTSGPADTQPPVRSDPRGPARQGTEDDLELSAEQVRGLEEVREASDQFTDQVLIADSQAAKDTKARLLRARGRAASTAWRDDPAGGRRLLGLLADDVAVLRGKVRLLSSPVLLTGTVRTVPLTVQNELEQPVNVGVGLPTSEAARLESSDAALQVVPPQTAVDVQVRVEARTSGRFTVQATLLDAEGRPFGQQVPLEVRSTQYGRVAVAVTGVAAAVLMVAAGVRLVRRALGRRSTAPDSLAA